MDRTDFRAEAHRVVDWIADYLENLGEYPVYPDVRPGDIKQQLPAAAPAAGESFERIFADFLSIILPGMTHWQHPRFFAFFPANSSPPSLLAEFLISALGAQCMSWETSPAATELEEQMLEWMRTFLNLPAGWRGAIQPGVTIAGICSLQAARFAKDAELKRRGAYTCYFSTECHSSVEKMLRVGGIEPAHVRKIPVGSALAIDISALRKTIQDDIEAGFTPLFAVATIGTTSTGAVDSVSEMAAICKEFGIWLHIDAAYFGSAFALPECASLTAGIADADSIAINPNKEMFVNFECTLHFFRNAKQLREALSVLPAYLKGDHDEAVTNFRDYGVALGRKFHALKLWFVLRSYGVDRIREMLRSHISLATHFEQVIRESPDFELITERSLSIVCFRYNPGDVPEESLEQFNHSIQNRLNASGQAYLSQTAINGKFALRFVPATTYVTLKDVDETWQLIVQHARAARTAWIGGNAR